MGMLFHDFLYEETTEERKTLIHGKTFYNCYICACTTTEVDWAKDNIAREHIPVGQRHTQWKYAHETRKHSQSCIQKYCVEGAKIEVLDNVVGIYIQYNFIKMANLGGGGGGGGARLSKGIPD